MRSAITTGLDVRINALSYHETRRGLLATRQAAKLVKLDVFCDIFIGSPEAGGAA